MSNPRDLAIWVVIRDEVAQELHALFCDGRHDDSDGPCWTAWRTEADSMMPRVMDLMARAWAEGTYVPTHGNPYRGEA